MPTTARRTTATSDTARDTAAGEKSSSSVQEEATNAADAAATAGSATATSLGQVLRLPLAVARTVADDVASTARRPDAVLYWGGLAGLAALGVLEWPVAAVAGVGVAVANGVRRARA